MKTSIQNLPRLARLVALALLTILNFPLSTFAQGTAFTYQGRFTDNGAPYTGNAEFQATLWSVASGGAALATNSPAGVVVAVTNGLFVLPLDFGASFPGANRWLQLDVRTVVGPFTPLTPRQQLTPTPYALTAGNLTGTVSATGLSGAYSGAVTFNNAGNSFTGSGAGLTSLNAGNLASGTVPDARLSANVSLLGPTIESAEITDGTIAAVDVNAASFNTTFWQVAGNAGTTAGAHFLGTTDNQPLEIKVNGLRALRLEPNTNGAPNLIGGSPRNFVGAGVVGATIAGGGATNYGGVAYTNSVLSDFGVVGGGRRNNIGVNARYSAIGGGQDNNIAANSTYATIAGGGFNDIGTNSSYSAIGGGFGNNIATNSTYATIAGGGFNDIGTNARYSAIGGGYDNNIAVNSFSATIAGGLYNDIGTDSPYSAIGGGYDNNIAVNSFSATIAGGYLNDIATNSYYSAIGGGYDNNIAASSAHATIAGGYLNNIAASSLSPSIAGGGFNDIGINSHYSAIGGGRNNNIADSSSYATIAGGDGNKIGVNSDYSAIGGGSANTIADNAKYATIPGGYLNFATNSAFAAGSEAKAKHQGAFVWGDSTVADIASTSANSVTMRAAGGYRLFSNSGATAGVSLAANGTAWAVISDRNVKKDFASVDARGILEKLAAMPITQWHYQWEDAVATPHLGPMAQDFKAAFYPGRDDKSITTQEADGVALAAIQGLNQKVEAGSQRSEARIQSLETENAELKQIVNELKQLVGALADKVNGGAK